MRLGLARRRGSLRNHAVLVRLRLCYRGFSQSSGPLDRRVPLRIGRRHLRVALDARHIRPAHVRDVLVLVAHFLDRERDHLQAHLAHVFGARRAHPLAHHLGLFHNLLYCQLSDDPAQMSLHHQSDQPFALRRTLG